MILQPSHFNFHWHTSRYLLYMGQILLNVKRFNFANHFFFKSAIGQAAKINGTNYERKVRSDTHFPGRPGWWTTWAFQPMTCNFSHQRHPWFPPCSQRYHQHQTRSPLFHVRIWQRWRHHCLRDWGAVSLAGSLLLLPKHDRDLIQSSSNPGYHGYLHCHSD